MSGPSRALVEWWYRQSEKDLRAFVKVAWPLVQPGNPFIPNWHIDAITDHLMGVSLGHIRNLCINTPPREGKSTVVSVLYPAWEWIQWPHMQNLFIAHSEPNLLRDSVLTKIVIESPWFQRRFGDRFTLIEATKHKFTNDKGGFREVVSMNGRPTGKGGDKVVADDPNDVSEETRGNPDTLDKAWEIYSKQFSTRLNDQKLGQRVVVQQRVGDRDITGRLKSGDDGRWTFLILPTEFNPKRRCVTVNKAVRPVPLGDPRAITSPYGKRRRLKATAYQAVTFRDPRTDDRELMFPQRFGPDEVYALKYGVEGVGEWAFEGQYNQDPIPREGGMFPRANWQFYRRPPVDDKNRVRADQWLQSWDMAFKEVRDSDWVVGSVWLKLGIDFYLVYVKRGRLSFSRSCQAIIDVSNAWPQAVLKLIEDKANGPAIEDALKKDVPGILMVNPLGGKEARANAVEPLHRTRHLWLPDYINGCEWPDGRIDPRTGKMGWRPHDTSWVADWITEWERFNKGTYDDQVDSGTQALNYWIPKMKLRSAAPLSVTRQVSPWATPR